MAQTKSSLLSTPGNESTRPWHKSAFRFQALSTSIYLVLIIAYIVSSTRGGAVGTTELYSGQCNHAANINRVLQAVLSLLAICISISFDFFMRLVSSPNVEDLRKAHTQGRSFDIAIHSLRNVSQISYWRIAAWMILVLTAIPIQLFFHSIIFICFSSTDYSVLFASEAFTTGQAFAYPGVGFLDQNAFDEASGLHSRFDEVLPDFKLAAGSWDKLEVGECSRTYYEDPAGLQTHRNLLLVVTGPDAGVEGWTGARVWMDQTTPLAYTSESIDEYDPNLTNSLWSFAIDCQTDRRGESDNTQFTLCRGSQVTFSGRYEKDLMTTRDPSMIFVHSYTAASCYHNDCSNMNASYQYMSVNYCLSEPYSAPCKLYVSNLFLLITMICILLGCTCSILVTRFCWNEETCQSLGDAVQAFMKHGETFGQMRRASTVGCSLEGGASSSSGTGLTPARGLKNYRRFWAQAVSKRVWLWTYVPIGSLLLGGSVALRTTSIPISDDYVLGESLNNRFSPIYTSSPSSYYNRNIFAPSNGRLKLVVFCLIVNSPQLCISSCYFAFSSLYSTLFQAQYWANFAIKAQPLRVSFPREQQERTPALQFPLAWGLSFITLKAAIGWCLTQSFYFLPIAKLSSQHQEIEFEKAEMFVGYSMKALVLTVVIAALAASIPLLLSLRHLPPSSDIIGTNSAVLAAYCPVNTIRTRHQEICDTQQEIIAAWDDVWRSHRHLQPLRWGMLYSEGVNIARPETLGLGTLGLGTEDEVLGLPIEGQNYVSVTGHLKLYLPSFGSTWVIQTGTNWRDQYAYGNLQ